jgi:hypothetical protein
MESTKHFLKEQFRMLTLKANAPSDSLAILSWSRIAEKLVETFGEGKVRAAVQRWLEQEQFFPANPNDLRKYFPSAQRETCPTCLHTEGWAYIRDERNGRKKVVRCTHEGGAR